MTQLRVEKEDKGLSLDTPFISFFFQVNTETSSYFQIPPQKMFRCTERGVGFDMGKKEKD